MKTYLITTGMLFALIALGAQPNPPLQADAVLAYSRTGAVERTYRSIGPRGAGACRRRCCVATASTEKARKTCRGRKKKTAEPASRGLTAAQVAEGSPPAKVEDLRAAIE